MGEYRDYIPVKGETVRAVQLCKMLAERANLLDKLHDIETTIESMDLARDELDALLCNIRKSERERKRVN
jgi:hypothetical protein